MRYLITCGGFFARANAHFERISGIQILGPFWQDFEMGPKKKTWGPVKTQWICYKTCYEML